MMKICKMILMVFVVGLLLPDTSTAQYSGTDLRGRVQSYQGMPLGGIRVDLLVFNGYTGRWDIVGTSFTDHGGMYYFFRVRQGSFTLQVNGFNNYPIYVNFIDRRFYEFQDIPPIVL